MKFLFTNITFSVTESWKYVWLCTMWGVSPGKATVTCIFSPIFHRMSAIAVSRASCCSVSVGLRSLLKSTIYFKKFTKNCVSILFDWNGFLILGTLIEYKVLDNVRLKNRLKSSSGIPWWAKAVWKVLNFWNIFILGTNLVFCFVIGVYIALMQFYCKFIM